MDAFDLLDITEEDILQTITNTVKEDMKNMNAETQSKVPVITGNLKNSYDFGKINGSSTGAIVNGQNTISACYSADYAEEVEYTAVHGEKFYFSNPFIKMQENLENHIIENLEKKLR